MADQYRFQGHISVQTSQFAQLCLPSHRIFQEIRALCDKILVKYDFLSLKKPQRRLGIFPVLGVICRLLSKRSRLRRLYKITSSSGVVIFSQKKLIYWILLVFMLRVLTYISSGKSISELNKQSLVDIQKNVYLTGNELLPLVWNTTLLHRM